eukprot:5431749-Pleurochrysis_carterae.AAC.2
MADLKGSATRQCARCGEGFADADAFGTHGPKGASSPRSAAVRAVTHQHRLACVFLPSRLTPADGTPSAARGRGKERGSKGDRETERRKD